MICQAISFWPYFALVVHGESERLNRYDIHRTSCLPRGTRNSELCAVICRVFHNYATLDDESSTDIAQNLASLKMDQRRVTGVSRKLDGGAGAQT